MFLSPDEEIRSREDLVAAIHGLLREFQQRGQEWENSQLEDFLRALAAWIEDSDGWYRNFGKELPPDGDWAFFARALSAATVYE